MTRWLFWFIVSFPLAAVLAAVPLMLIIALGASQWVGGVVGTCAGIASACFCLPRAYGWRRDA